MLRVRGEEETASLDLSLKEKNGLLDDMFAELNDKIDQLAEEYQ